MQELTMTGILSQIHEKHIRDSNKISVFNPIKDYCNKLSSFQRPPRGYQ